MSGANEKENSYWTALDGLRALAVFLVVFHHLGALPARPSLAGDLLNKVISWGWIGVDCFFVISGFLITRLLIQEKSRLGSISLSKFYTRRVLRIWPLYYLTLFVAFIAIPLSSPNHHPTIEEWISYVPRTSLPFIMFGGNFEIIFDWKSLYEFNKLIPGLATNMICAILMPLWSIAIEEQFYLIWPWLMNKCASLKALSVTALFVIGGGIAATAAIICGLQKNTGETLYNYYYLNTACRLLPIMFGALLAIAHFAKPSGFAELGNHGIRLSALMAAISATTLYCLPPIEQVSVLHVLTFICSATTFSLLLLLSLSWKPLNSFFSNKLLVYVGKRSYAIYLVHITCIWSVRMFICPMLHIKVFTATEWVVTALIAVPLTILAAELSWHLIEKHFLKLRTAFSPISVDPTNIRQPAKQILIK